MTTYTKKPLKIDLLYQKLVDRNLTILPEDKGIVFTALERIGYYRLTGYCLPFMQVTANQKKVFVPGTTIHSILALYEFDTNVRSLALQELAKIEIALATSICNTLCVEHHALWYADKNVFNSQDGHQNTFDEAIKHLRFDAAANKGIPKNPNPFLRHYYSTYTNPKLPPAWMLRECAPFGFWSHTYEDLNKASKTLISESWKYPNRKPIQPPVFESWMHSLSVFRNRCAHHNRITNTTLPYDPKTPDNVPAAERFKSGQTNDLRTFLLLIDILMRNIAQNSDWKDRLYAHFDTAAQKNVAVGRATGFNFDWKNDNFWSDWTAPVKATPPGPKAIAA